MTSAWLMNSSLSSRFSFVLIPSFLLPAVARTLLKRNRIPCSSRTVVPNLIYCLCVTNDALLLSYLLGNRSVCDGRVSFDLFYLQALKCSQSCPAYGVLLTYMLSSYLTLSMTFMNCLVISLCSCWTYAAIKLESRILSLLTRNDFVVNMSAL